MVLFAKLEVLVSTFDNPLSYNVQTQSLAETQHMKTWGPKMISTKLVPTLPDLSLLLELNELCPMSFKAQGIELASPSSPFFEFNPEDV